MNSPKNSRFVTTLFIGVLVGATLLLAHLLAVYMAAIVMAAVLVTLFQPVFQKICDKCGDRRRIAATGATAAVVLLVMLPVTLALTSLWAEALGLYERATAGDQPFSQKILSLVDTESMLFLQVREIGNGFGLDLSPEGLKLLVTKAGTTLGRGLYEELRGFATNVLRTFMHFGLMIVVMFAFFSDGSRLKAYILDLSPIPDEQEERLLDRFRALSRAIFLGNGVASGLQGVLGGIGFYLFDVGSGVLWGSAIAFFAFLPIVGATIVFVPAALYLFARGEVGAALGFVAYNAAYISVLEYGLKPRLIGEHSQMSGVLVFVGILAGLNLYGILGLFYGPLILTMFLALADIYKSEYRNDLMSVLSPWALRERAEQ